MTQFFKPSLPLFYYKLIMFCKCLPTQLAKEEKEYCQQIQKQPHKQPPLAMKMASVFGLKSFIFDNFLFNRSEPGYTISINDEEVRMTMPSVNPRFLHIFRWEIDILEDQKKKLSIPIVHVQNTRKYKPSCTIVYSHGNSSDLSGGLSFLLELAEKRNINIVVYDYTGYGASKSKQTTEQSICADLQLIITKLKVPLPSIILWGFSLGTYPTIHVASKYDMGGVILQSPLASLASFMDTPSEDPTLYQGDSLNSLSKIDKIYSPILMMHSLDDEIIPFFHAKKLYNRYIRYNSSSSIRLVEIVKVGHNNLHQLFIEQQGNYIQKYLFEFLEEVESAKMEKLEKIIKTSSLTFTKLHSEIETQGNIPESKKDNSQIIIEQ